MRHSGGRTTSRSIAAALALALVAGVFIGPRALSAQPRAEIEQEAAASWLVPKKKADRYRWYLIEVVRRREAAGAARTLAALVKGSCEVDEFGDGWGMFCHGIGHINALRAGESHIDPLLRSASVDFRAEGVRNIASWDAEPHGSLYEYWEACVDFEGETGRGRGEGIYRPARATGEILGRSNLAVDLPYEMADLTEQAKVTTCDPFMTTGIDWSRVSPGDAVEVALRV